MILLAPALLFTLLPITVPPHDSAYAELATTVCDSSAGVAPTGVAPVEVANDPRSPVPGVAGFDSASAAVADTLPPRRPRARAVEYSDWYTRRLTIHRWASYATLPLFAAQFVTGDQLLKHGRDATTARRAHGPIATAIAGLFGVNTVTGVWNLYDARHDPAGRTRRNIHALLMLAAGAGFVWAGTLASSAENSAVMRERHKRVALTSMGVSLVSYAIMLPLFRRD